MSNNDGKKWALSSSIFHAVDEMLFVNDKMNFKVSYMLKGTGQRTFNIFNPEQINKFLYEHLKDMYNHRIENHKLTFYHLQDHKEDLLSLKLYQPAEKNMSSEEYSDFSGYYRIYPRGVYCVKCHDFVLINDENINKIQHNNCQHKNCEGYYRQIPMVKFCEKCGKIDEIYFKCRKELEHIAKGKKPTMKLVWESYDDVRSWRFKCDVCASEGVYQNNELPDVFKIPCYHLDYGKTQRCIDPKTAAYKPRSVLSGSGGVISPKVLTMVDIPPMKTLKHPKREQIICAVIAGKLEFLKSKIKEGTILEFIDNQFQSYNSKNNKHAVINALKSISPDKTSEDLEKEFAKAYNIPEIENAIHETTTVFQRDQLNMEEITNFHALKGTFSNELNTISFNDRISEKDENIKHKVSQILEKYHIKGVSYLSKLKLISACIGTINGPTHSNEEEFAPHFEPLWSDKKKEKMHAYCHPYETEGILIEFDKEKIVKWLEKITGKNESSANKTILFMKENDDDYKLVYTLLHTLSHLLIKKSSIFTGIDTDSCSEMILPTSGAILIYATNTINIGGFGSLFEQDILDLFTEADLEMRKCIYDPVCISEKGSCFSCMYLSEFVCCNFNNLLDRDVLIGTKRRFNERFW